MTLICDLPLCFKSYLSRGVGKREMIPFLSAILEQILRRLAYLTSSEIDSGKRKRQENVEIEVNCTSKRLVQVSNVQGIQVNQKKNWSFR